MLDLWHPTAASNRRLVVDGSDMVVPANGEPLDLAVISRASAGVARERLRRAVAHAAVRLAADGVLVVIVPRTHRRTAERALRGTGASLAESVLMAPQWPATAHFVPLRPGSARDAAVRHLGIAPLAARALGALTRTAFGRTVLRRVAPGCALIITRAPAAARMQWLHRIAGGEAGGVATVSLGPRQDARVAVVMRFPSKASRPDVAVKVALDGPGVQRLRRERTSLARLSSEAEQAGALIPRPSSGGPDWALTCPALPGNPAAVAITRAPQDVEELVHRVTRWLRRWNAATAHVVTATEALLDDVLLTPAARIAATGAVGNAYAQALEALADRVVGRDIVQVAAHNDLTMQNVLADRGRIAVLDWEAATPDGLPLGDLWYVLADGLARAGATTHATAVAALVRQRPPASAGLWRTPLEAAAALGLSRDERLLAFHAGWLAHAGDELTRGAPGPFTSTVRAVAHEQLLWPLGDACAS